MTDLEKLAYDVAVDILRCVVPPNRSITAAQCTSGKELALEALEAARAAGRLDGLKEAAEIVEIRQDVSVDNPDAQEGLLWGKMDIRARIKELEGE